jgi:hypothetical protein
MSLSVGKQSVGPERYNKLARQDKLARQELARLLELEHAEGAPWGCRQSGRKGKSEEEKMMSTKARVL